MNDAAIDTSDTGIGGQAPQPEHRRSAPAAAVWIALGVSSTACTVSGRADSQQAVVRITGSDTMINLLQAWAEHYRTVRPAISVQVAGGGSGVGFAGLLAGTLDVAAASREMRPEEREELKRRMGAEPRELVVALDALAVYVNRHHLH